MTVVNSGTGIVQPAPQASGKDTGTAQGILSGGVTPGLDAVLKTAPPALAEAVKEHIGKQTALLTQRTQELTSQQRQLAEDVQIASAFKQLRQDPRFDEFIRAYESNDLAGFHRRSLGYDTNGRANPIQDNQIDATGAHQPKAESRDDLAIIQREAKEALRQTAELKAQILRMGTKSEAEAFAKENPDVSNYLPMMQKIVTDAPGLSLKDALILAKYRVGSGAVDSQAAAQETKGGDQPPMPIHSSGVSSTNQPRTFNKNLNIAIREAFQYAKETAGAS